MYTVDKTKVKFIKSITFYLYISVILTSIIFSFLKWFDTQINTGSILVSISIFTYIFSGPKTQIIYDFLTLVLPSDNRKFKVRQFLLSGLGNLPLTFSITLFYFDFFKIRTSSGFELGYIFFKSVLSATIIILLALSIKWFIKTSQKIIYYRPTTVWKDIEYPHDNILNTYITGFKGIGISDDYWSDLERYEKIYQEKYKRNLNQREYEQFSENYHGLKDCIYSYYIELRETKKNDRYYLLYCLDGKFPLNFNEDDFIKLIKNNSEINISVPMFAVDRDIEPFVIADSYKNKHSNNYLLTMKNQAYLDLKSWLNFK